LIGRKADVRCGLYRLRRFRSSKEEDMIADTTPPSGAEGHGPATTIGWSDPQLVAGGRLTRWDVHLRLFGNMMERFAVPSVDTLSPRQLAQLRAAMKRCAACPSVSRCELWMASTRGIRGADAFCPNAAAFARLALREAPRA